MDNKKWAEQFKSSIRARDESDYRLEHVLPYKKGAFSVNFSKLSSDGLQDLLASKAVYAAEIEAELSVLSDEMVEIDMVLSDRQLEEVAA